MVGIGMAAARRGAARQARLVRSRSGTVALVIALQDKAGMALPWLGRAEPSLAALGMSRHGWIGCKQCSA